MQLLIQNGLRVRTAFVSGRPSSLNGLRCVSRFGRFGRFDRFGRFGRFGRFDRFGRVGSFVQQIKN